MSPRAGGRGLWRRDARRVRARRRLHAPQHHRLPPGRQPRPDRFRLAARGRRRRSRHLPQPAVLERIPGRSTKGRGRQGVVGLYYLDANANNVFDVVLATTSPIARCRASPPRPSATSTPRPGRSSPTSPTTSPTNSQLSLGGRYTNDRRRATVIRANLLNGASPALGRQRRPARRADLQLPGRGDFQRVHAARFAELPARRRTTRSTRASPAASKAAASIRAAFRPRRPTSTATARARRTRFSTTSCSSPSGHQLRDRLQGQPVRPAPAPRHRRLLCGL